MSDFFSYKIPKIQDMPSNTSKKGKVIAQKKVPVQRVKRAYRKKVPTSNGKLPPNVIGRPSKDGPKKPTYTELEGKLNSAMVSYRKVCVENTELKRKVSKMRHEVVIRVETTPMEYRTEKPEKIIIDLCGEEDIYKDVSLFDQMCNDIFGSPDHEYIALSSDN